MERLNVGICGHLSVQRYPPYSSHYSLQQVQDDLDHTIPSHSSMHFVINGADSEIFLRGNSYLFEMWISRRRHLMEEDAQRRWTLFCGS